MKSVELCGLNPRGGRGEAGETEGWRLSRGQTTLTPADQAEGSDSVPWGRDAKLHPLMDILEASYGFCADNRL